MTGERERRIKEIVEAAKRLDKGERAAFLDGACMGDPALRGEVEAGLVPAGPEKVRTDVDSGGAWR